MIHKNNIEQTFANNLKYLINNNIISVKTILKITKHKSKSLISMWCSGERLITLKDVVIISDYLGISIDELVNSDLRGLSNDTQR